MKKIILTALVVLAVYSNSFAMELNDYKVLSRLNNESSLRSLARYLKANETQREQLAYIFELTQKKIDSALTREDKVAAQKALYFNLGNMKHLLTDKQYKQYLVVLNLTVSGNYDVYIAEN